MHPFTAILQATGGFGVAAVRCIGAPIAPPGRFIPTNRPWTHGQLICPCRPKKSKIVGFCSLESTTESTAYFFFVFSHDFALAFVRKRCEWCYRVRLSPLYSLGVFLSLVFIDFIFEILFFFLSFLLSFSCTNILILIFEKNVLLRSHA